MNSTATGSPPGSASAASSQSANSARLASPVSGSRPAALRTRASLVRSRLVSPRTRAPAASSVTMGSSHCVNSSIGAPPRIASEPPYAIPTQAVWIAIWRASKKQTAYSVVHR